MWNPARDEVQITGPANGLVPPGNGHLAQDVADRRSSRSCLGSFGCRPVAQALNGPGSKRAPQLPGLDEEQATERINGRSCRCAVVNFRGRSPAPGSEASSMWLRSLRPLATGDVDQVRCQIPYEQTAIWARPARPGLVIFAPRIRFMKGTWNGQVPGRILRRELVLDLAQPRVVPGDDPARPGRV